MFSDKNFTPLVPESIVLVTQEELFELESFKCVLSAQKVTLYLSSNASFRLAKLCNV